MQEIIEEYGVSLLLCLLGASLCTALSGLLAIV